MEEGGLEERSRKAAQKAWVRWRSWVRRVMGDSFRAMVLAGCDFRFLVIFRGGLYAGKVGR